MIKVLHGTDGKYHLFDSDARVAVDCYPFASKTAAESEAKRRNEYAACANESVE